jgi:hypothetical protein
MVCHPHQHNQKLPHLWLLQDLSIGNKESGYMRIGFSPFPSGGPAPGKKPAVDLHNKT